MNPLCRATLLATLSCLGFAVPSGAHFQEIIPATDTADKGGPLAVEMTFTHPMDRGPVMDMARPKRVGVKSEAGTEDLTGRIEKRTVEGKGAWSLNYDLKKPGGHVFFVEPQPYWEPAEGKFIIHYSKVVVDAFESGEGWDTMVGFPVEIEPLVRPYGVWAGNVFRGIVRRNGKSVPFAEVEVEWRNDGSLKPPSSAFSTQVIKADGNGVFSYAMPRAGWWGFAALLEADKPMKNPEGKNVPVEIGALIWVRTTDMK